MHENPNPVLLYAPDAYEVARKDLKGRHVAGQSFLTAFVEQSTASEIVGLCLGAGSAEHFAASIASFPNAPQSRAIGRGDIAVLRSQGLLYTPAPQLAEEAELRSFLGDSAYALCGVTHTLCSRRVLDSLAAMAVAPVMPWDALICTSPAAEQAIAGVLERTEEQLRARLGARRFVRPMLPVIPLGIHSARFAPRPADRERWRARLGITPDVAVVLFFGRLAAHAKASPFQLAQAAEAAAQASGKKLAVVWCGMFAGEGQRRTFMETAQAMAPSVPFHHVDGSQPDAESVWAAADIFCSLSDNIQETFGLTVIEAMAAGLPAVVSNWNGYRTAIKHEANGVLVDSYLPATSLAEVGYRYASGMDTYEAYVGAVSQFCFVDVAQTAHWLARLAGDEALRKRLGAAARETVEASFDWRAVLPQYRELWREQGARLAHARSQKIAPAASPRHDPGITFAGFPSRKLAGSSRLARGPEFSKWREIAKQPGIIVNPAVLAKSAQYAAVCEAFDAGKGSSVDEVLARFEAAQRPVLLRTLHWMIKIGLLQVK